METPDTNNRGETYDKWKLKNAPNDSGSDYDLLGAFKANLQPAENGHFPDTFKLPNHPTFSKESIYSTEDEPGGNWGKDDKGRDTFKPSAWMGSNPKRQEDLKSYFKKREPNATLIDSDVYIKPDHSSFGVNKLTGSFRNQDTQRKFNQEMTQKKQTSALEKATNNPFN